MKQHLNATGRSHNSDRLNRPYFSGYVKKDKYVYIVIEL